MLLKIVCEDSRIGNYYNKQLFVYRKYCLKKDTTIIK